MARSHPWLLKIKVYKSYFKMWSKWFAWMFGKRKQKWWTYHFGDISFQAPPQEAAAPPNHHRSSTTLGEEALIRSCMILCSHKTTLYPHMHHTMPSQAWYYALTCKDCWRDQGRQREGMREFRSEWERARAQKREKNQRKHVQYVQSVRTPHNPSGRQPCAPFFTLHFHHLPLLGSLRVLHESCS